MQQYTLTQFASEEAAHCAFFAKIAQQYSVKMQATPHMLVSLAEPGSVIEELRAMKKMGTIELTCVRRLAAMPQAIAHNTALIITSYVNGYSGDKADLSAITEAAHQRSIPVHVHVSRLATVHAIKFQTLDSFTISIPKCAILGIHNRLVSGYALPRNIFPHDKALAPLLKSTLTSTTQKKHLTILTNTAKKCMPPDALLSKLDYVHAAICVDATQAQVPKQLEGKFKITKLTISAEKRKLLPIETTAQELWIVHFLPNTTTKDVERLASSLMIR